MIKQFISQNTPIGEGVKLTIDPGVLLMHDLDGGSILITTQSGKSYEVEIHSSTFMPTIINIPADIFSGNILG